MLDIVITGDSTSEVACEPLTAKADLALARFVNSDVAPWNYMMATAIIYALPPLATYYAFRNRMSSGLTMGGVKG